MKHVYKHSQIRGFRANTLTLTVSLLIHRSTLHKTRCQPYWRHSMPTPLSLMTSRYHWTRNRKKKMKTDEPRTIQWRRCFLSNLHYYIMIIHVLYIYICFYVRFLLFIIVVVVFIVPLRVYIVLPTTTTFFKNAMH